MGPFRKKIMPGKYSLTILLILSSLTLYACRGASEPTPTNEPVEITQPTPDLCAPENIAAEVEKVHRIMREFDDESLLAANTPLDQLNASISKLQSIRRDAEDQPVPECLVTLKRHQLSHMNTVINTLLGFLSGADEESISQSIELARQQHDEYTLELARLLGLTVAAPPSIADGQETTIVVSNPGPTAVNVMAEPDPAAQSLGILDVGASTMAVGRNTDGSWIQIAVPDEPELTVWVFADLIELSGPMEALPITTP
jgi:hypothetical protein